MAGDKVMEHVGRVKPGHGRQPMGGGSPAAACLANVVGFVPGAACARLKAIWSVSRADFAQRWDGMAG
jgi:hypothetical protein